MEIYEIVVLTFSMSNKHCRKQFIEKIFLLADVQPDILLGMLLLNKNDANVDLQVQDLSWRSYAIGDVFSTTRRVGLIKKKEFATLAIDPEHKGIVVNVTAFRIDWANEMHPS